MPWISIVNTGQYSEVTSLASVLFCRQHLLKLSGTRQIQCNLTSSCPGDPGQQFALQAHQRRHALRSIQALVITANVVLQPSSFSCGNSVRLAKTVANPNRIALD
jgi:hypothetical protein